MIGAQSHLECSGCPNENEVKWYCMTCFWNLCDICKETRLHKKHIIKEWIDPLAKEARDSRLLNRQKEERKTYEHTIKKDLNQDYKKYQEPYEWLVAQSVQSLPLPDGHTQELYDKGLKKHDLPSVTLTKPKEASSFSPELFKEHVPEKTETSQLYTSQDLPPLKLTPGAKQQYTLKHYGNDYNHQYDEQRNIWLTPRQHKLISEVGVLSNPNVQQSPNQNHPQTQPLRHKEQSEVSDQSEKPSETLKLPPINQNPHV